MQAARGAPSAGAWTVSDAVAENPLLAARSSAARADPAAPRVSAAARSTPDTAPLPPGARRCRKFGGAPCMDDRCLMTGKFKKSGARRAAANRPLCLSAKGGGASPAALPATQPMHHQRRWQLRSHGGGRLAARRGDVAERPSRAPRLLPVPTSVIPFYRCRVLTSARGAAAEWRGWEKVAKKCTCRVADHNTLPRVMRRAGHVLRLFAVRP